MAISVGADLSGMNDYIGTVGGILQAVEDPRFKGDFTEHMMDSVESAFMVESIAMKARIPHVFEWGDEQGEVSNIPLFRVTRSGGKGNRKMGYVFLPSTKHVPLPGAKYGIKQQTLDSLRRHTFQLKAIVMETKSKVRIEPVGAKRLFVPTMDPEFERGYYMTSNPTTINPGGKSTTGSFALWWNEWFSTRGDAVVRSEVEATQNWLVATGAKHVRYAAGTSIGGKKVGGRFAAGRNVSASYVNSKEASVKRKVMAESELFFDDRAYDATWDD